MSKPTSRQVSDAMYQKWQDDRCRYFAAGVNPANAIALFNQAWRLGIRQGRAMARRDAKVRKMK